MRPSARGWFASIAPIPLAEQTTGICSRSANRTNSADAPAYLTPWPTMITGRLASSSISTALRAPSGSAPQRHEMLVFQICCQRHFDVGFFLENIERHVEHDWPGAAGDHGFPCLAYEERDLLGALGLENAFAERP